MSDKIEIWTDGACSGNPGPGGWGVVMKVNGKDSELFGGEAATTNNRMELMAAIMALESLPAGAKPVLHTDSQYVKDGLTKWIKGWKRNGWKTADRKPVKNQDLWMRLETAALEHQVDWRWVRGHDGNEGNERADALARKGCDQARVRS
jgi:ribonuclease HI